MAFVASANDPYAAHDTSELYAGNDHYMPQPQSLPHTQHTQHTQQSQHIQHTQHAQHPQYQQQQHFAAPTDPAMPSFYSASLANGISCDIKPRLTKEQHDILESHYQKQQKPNTSTKKNFAESLHVSLEKVNVSAHH